MSAAYFAIAVMALPGAPSLSSAREDGAGKGVGRWRCASAHLPTPIFYSSRSVPTAARAFPAPNCEFPAGMKKFAAPVDNFPVSSAQGICRNPLKRLRQSALESSDCA